MAQSLVATQHRFHLTRPANVLKMQMIQHRVAGRFIHPPSRAKKSAGVGAHTAFNATTTPPQRFPTLLVALQRFTTPLVTHSEAGEAQQQQQQHPGATPAAQQTTAAAAAGVESQHPPLCTVQTAPKPATARAQACQDCSSSNSSTQCISSSSSATVIWQLTLSLLLCTTTISCKSTS